jgi:hypothetical protein
MSTSEEFTKTMEIKVEEAKTLSTRNFIKDRLKDYGADDPQRDRVAQLELALKVIQSPYYADETMLDSIRNRSVSELVLKEKDFIFSLEKEDLLDPAANHQRAVANLKYMGGQLLLKIKADSDLCKVNEAYYQEKGRPEFRVEVGIRVKQAKAENKLRDSADPAEIAYQEGVNTQPLLKNRSAKHTHTYIHTGSKAPRKEGV